MSERALRDALAVIGEWDRDAARDAQSALGWMGWEEDGPLHLRRYDVQIFVWSILPRKYLASLEEKRQIAGSLATLLERLGGPAAGYADVCRSPETDDLLRAWEDEDPAAPKRLRELMEGSGLEPPDTALHRWGDMMGLEEARARDRVATALEEALEGGRLEPGASASHRRRQADVADAAVLEPRDDDPGRSRLDAVLAERLERWLGRGGGSLSPARGAIIDPVAALIEAGEPEIESAAAGAAVVPALWLLDRAGDGIALTQTEALSRAFVREAAERFPHWWEADLFGPPHRETDVTLLRELHWLLRRLRLLRRTGRRVVVTKRGRDLAAQPPALITALATELLAGEAFPAACAELTAALILGGAAIDYSDRLAERIQPAIAADGWRSAGEPPDVRDIRWTIASFLRPAEAAGVLVRGERESRSSALASRLTEAGRPALIAGLRARALAPVKWIA